MLPGGRLQLCLHCSPHIIHRPGAVARHMKAVNHDSGLREECSGDIAVALVHIHHHILHILAIGKGTQVGLNGGNPSVRQNIQDTPLFRRGQNLATWGIALSTNMWWFELLLLQQGVDLVDQDNGRAGPATRTVFADNELSYQIAEKWLELYQKGYASNTGFASSDCRTVFFAGLAPIILDSSSSLRDYVDTVADNFELNVCTLPTLTDGAPNGGVTLGGASLYVVDKKEETKLDAVAEFIKYLISADAQSLLCLNTGYYSVTKAVYELDAVKENMAKYPQYVTVRDIMRSSQVIGHGAIYGVFTEGRATYKNYFEEMLLGEITPKECIDNSASNIDLLISEYNEANQ